LLDVYFGVTFPDGSFYSYADGAWQNAILPLRAPLVLDPCSPPVTLFDLEAVLPDAIAPGIYTFIVGAFDSDGGRYQDSMRLSLRIETAGHGLKAPARLK
jgi:hypothetical protein